MIGDSLTTSLLQRALDGTWKRESAIANNIANHETPGYKAVKVSFEDALDREVRKLKNDDVSSGGIEKRLGELRKSEISAYSDTTTSERADGNNVNLDQENIDMSRTQIQYQYLTREMTDLFARLRYAISEGKK